MIKVRVFLIIVFFIIYPASFIQSGEKLVNQQLRELIDIPTAGTLPHKCVGIDLRLYPQGGVLAGGGIGILNRLTFAVYYGGENVIGDGKVNWNPQIGVELRARIIDESFALPAIAIGFSTQGWEGYQKALDRYTIKARGFYVVASRNYQLLGNFGFHGGINKSIENDDRDNDINVFVGMDKELYNGIELLIDYDFALNDNGHYAIGEGNGYLNIGIRWAVTQNYYFEIDFKNLTKNRPHITEISREIKFGFARTF